MKAPSVPPIALAMCCASAIVCAADDGALGMKPHRPKFELRLDPSMLAAPIGNSDPLPVFIEADSIRGHQEKEIEAEGSVRLRRRGQAVYADWLRYDKPEDEVNARGNVRLEARGDTLEGPRMRLNLESERGSIDEPKYQVQMKGNTGRGEAERILLEGEGKYRAERASYTSCEVGNNDWFVRANELEIDKGRQLGVARGASVEFLGRTILYTPYLSFSLDNQRKSGFLTPTVGTSSTSGGIVAIPYYWNIAPNRDATFTPRITTKRGIQLNSEFRYLDANYTGDMRLELLPTDPTRNDDTRYAATILHNHRWDSGWMGNVNLQKVSDDTYFTDLGTQIAVTSRSVLPREGSLGKSGSWWNDGAWSFSALLQGWQTLQTDPLLPLTAPYNRLPQLSLSATKQNIAYTDLDVYSSFVNFTHPTLVSGKRAVAYPSLSLPLQTSYAFVTPRIGVHSTYYDLDQANPAIADQSRTLPIFSTETGLVLERQASFFGQSLTQTVEPKLFYVYIPTRQQNQIPNFDSAVQDINFATLYSENQFSGNDRINDANQLTFGVNSRFLEQQTGLERLRVGVAQRYYFKSQEVTVPGVAPRGSSASDLLAAVSGTVVPQWTIDAGWQYTTDLSQTQKLSVGARYQPEPGKVLNLAYRYTNASLLTPALPNQPAFQNNTLRQVDASTQWPLSARWAGVARLNYSLFDSRLIEGLAGFEYNGGCWAFRVVGHRFVTATQNEVNHVFLQLELNGLSKIGSNPLELLRRSISGFNRDEPQSAARPEPQSPAY